MRVYNENGMAQRNGTGMFPREVVPKQARGFGQTHFPLLPIEEEGRLNDMPLRENFIDRVGVYPERSEGPTIAGPVG